MYLQNPSELMVSPAFPWPSFTQNSKEATSINLLESLESLGGLGIINLGHWGGHHQPIALPGHDGHAAQHRSGRDAFALQAPLDEFQEPSELREDQGLDSRLVQGYGSPWQLAGRCWQLGGWDQGGINMDLS